MPTLEAVAAALGAREGVDVEQAPGGWFFFHDPRKDTPPAKRMPFATLVATDAFDGVSNLEARGAWRLNLGIAMDSYRARFGAPPAWNREGMGIVATGHDWTVEDVLMPHPQYAPLGWVCVVNPRDATWDALLPLVEEAHEEARRRHRAMDRAFSAGGR